MFDHILPCSYRCTSAGPLNHVAKCLRSRVAHSHEVIFDFSMDMRLGRW